MHGKLCKNALCGRWDQGTLQSALGQKNSLSGQNLNRFSFACYSPTFLPLPSTQFQKSKARPRPPILVWRLERLALLSDKEFISVKLRLRIPRPRPDHKPSAGGWLRYRNTWGFCLKMFGISPSTIYQSSSPPPDQASSAPPVLPRPHIPRGRHRDHQSSWPIHSSTAQ